MDDRAISELLVSLQDQFRGPVIDELDDAVAMLVKATPSGQPLPPSTTRVLAAHRAHREGLAYLAGMIELMRVRLETAERTEPRTK